MATYVEYMRPRIRRDSIPHEFPSWRSSSGSSVPVSITPATGTLLAHDPFHHIADLGASHARSLFSSEISSSYTPGGIDQSEDFAEEQQPTSGPTDHSPFASEEPTTTTATGPAVLTAGKNHLPGALSPQRPKTASSAIFTASEKGDKPGHEIGPLHLDGSLRKERRQWGIGLGPQATAQNMAAVRGFAAPRAVNGAPTGSPVDPALYQNLVDMIPLMENFLTGGSALSSQAVSLKPNHPIPVLRSTHGQERSENFQSENLQEQQSGRTMFGHRSSMIYTAAPARDMLNRKISKSLVKAKSDVQSVCSKWGGARGEIPGREEGENIPPKVEAQTVSQFQSEIQELKQQLWEKDILLESIAQDSPCQIQEIEDLKQQLREKDSQIEEIAYKKSQNTQQLQTELEELKQKLYDSDRVLERAVKRSNAEIAISKASRDRDIKELETQVAELQQELWEENRLVQAAQLELSDKEHELEKIQSLLEQFEMDMIERDSQAENIVAEVNEVRSQVLKLRFQLDVVDTSSTLDAIQSDWATDDENNQLVCLTGQEMEQLIPPMSREIREQKEKIDLSRRQYLAAIIAAREVSSEELLVLVGELRKQLQAFLTEPSLIDSFCVNTQ